MIGKSDLNVQAAPISKIPKKATNLQKQNKKTINEEKPDPADPFAPLHGLSNTWQVPNSENMTTEEYYKAINDRLLEMKNRRKATGK